MTVKFKSDKYRKTRGGYSRFLNVHCEHCGAKILIYQKDGPGQLKRLYLDRIFAPENLANFQKLSISKVPNLVCSKCKTVLAVPYIYKKEDRKAYRLFVGAVTKKITKYESRFRKIRSEHEAHQSEEENVARRYCESARG